MTIDNNLKMLKSFILNNGWFLEREDLVLERYSNHLNISLSFPKIKDDVDYPRMLELLLKKLERFSPNVLRYPFFTALKSQCKNIRQKYNKNKNEWILLEPNCKYHYSEIPDIYIPKDVYLD